MSKAGTFKRVAISKRMRFEVFKRDQFTCQYCGATPPNVLLECDHEDPVSLGGKTEIDNLVTACHACNRGKSNIPLGLVSQSMADRAAETLERESQIAGYQAILKQKRMRLDGDAREILEAFCKYFTKDGIPKDHFTSIKRFVDKLGLDDVLFASELAMNKCKWNYNSSFRYFCGVCWGKIRDQEDIPQ